MHLRIRIVYEVVMISQIEITLKSKSRGFHLVTSEILSQLPKLPKMGMETKEFIQNYREAFGSKSPLPLLFGYSDKPIAETEKIGGCFFKGLLAAREGQPVSLSVDVIGCGGGKLYSGFSDMPERVPGFVSLKEKYKKTPEMVVDYLQGLGMKRTEKPYLNFIRIDKAE